MRVTIPGRINAEHLAGDSRSRVPPFGRRYADAPAAALLTRLSLLPTANAALDDLLEAIQDYAAEYLSDRDVYAQSSNRAHHLPYVEAIADCKTDWDLRALIEIQHGFVQLWWFPHCSETRWIRQAPLRKTRDVAKDPSERRDSQGPYQPSTQTAIPKWLFHEMLRQAGLNMEEFMRLLRKS
jgi:hypothetical protein